MKRRPTRPAITSTLLSRLVSAVTTAVQSTDEPTERASSLDPDFNPLPPVAKKQGLVISDEMLRKLGGGSAPDPAIGAAIASGSQRTHQGTEAIRAQFQAEQMQRAANQNYKK